jgi:hypothetical protein
MPLYSFSCFGQFSQLAGAEIHAKESTLRISASNINEKSTHYYSINGYFCSEGIRL